MLSQRRPSCKTRCEPVVQSPLLRVEYLRTRCAVSRRACSLMADNINNDSTADGSILAAPRASRLGHSTTTGCVITIQLRGLETTQEREQTRQPLSIDEGGGVEN